VSQSCVWFMYMYRVKSNPHVLHRETNFLWFYKYTTLALRCVVLKTMSYLWKFAVLERKIWIYRSESNSWIYFYIILNKIWKNLLIRLKFYWSLVEGPVLSVRTDFGSFKTQSFFFCFPNYKWLLDQKNVSTDKMSNSSHFHISLAKSTCSFDVISPILGEMNQFQRSNWKFPVFINWFEFKSIVLVILCSV
jgi:hypothetical protein